MGLFGCNHKFGTVVDGYQYCEKCGLAKTAECPHHYVELGVFGKGLRFSESYYKHIYVLQCSKCGDIKQVEIS